jgi:alpha-N-acetylglucosaminidase
VTGGEGGLALSAAPGAERGFRIECIGGTLSIEASDPIAACAGIHRYLADSGRRVSWDAVRPIRLDPLPSHPALRQRAVVDAVYALNFCTFSYSTAFWTWDDWEREIDWLALHGVTMPLALVGHEAVLARVLVDRGLGTDRIREFLGTPVSLPFLYMGCLDGFGAPLPEAWIDEHLALGRRILARMRELGMRPVLPGFTGHVPRELAGPAPVERTWQGSVTTALRPEDPEFERFARDIVRAQVELLGTDHLYAADPFIELIPDGPEGESYPERVAAALAAGFIAGDPDAVWVLQSWPFSYQRSYWSAERARAFLEAVPAGRLIVLDLFAESDPQWDRLAGFGDRPWLWCGLLDFGGRSDPIADLRAVIEGVSAALASARPPAGLGITMEAIHVTPVFFELVCDLAWRSDVDLDAWIREFGASRYGVQDPAIAQAWSDFGATLFDASAADIFPEKLISLTVRAPTYALFDDPDDLRDRVQRALHYDPARLLSAWRALLELGRTSPDLVAGPLGGDIVSIGTEILVRIVDARIERGVASRRTPDLGDLFETMDAWAASRPTSRLRAWEDAAARWGSTEPERSALVADARQLLTSWNPVGARLLEDYAARLWSGLLRYDGARWQAWVDGFAAATDASRRKEAERWLRARLDELTASLISDGQASAAPADLVELGDRVDRRYSAEFMALRFAKGKTPA